MLHSAAKSPTASKRLVGPVTWFLDFLKVVVTFWMLETLRELDAGEKWNVGCLCPKHHKTRVERTRRRRPIKLSRQFFARFVVWRSQGILKKPLALHGQPSLPYLSVTSSKKHSIMVWGYFSARSLIQQHLWMILAKRFNMDENLSMQFPLTSRGTSF